MFELATYLRDLETLVNQDSGSYDPEGLGRVAAFFEDAFRTLGWHVKRHELCLETGPLLEIYNRESDHYDALLMGHMDTVFPAGTAAQRPFRIEGNRAFGPGVSDMKHGLAAMLHLARTLPRDVLDRLNLCMLMNPDEEISSRYSGDLVREIARRTDVAYLLEAASTRDNAHCMRRKGMLYLTLEFHGIPAHAGYLFTVPNASAILELSHKTLALSALQDREKKTSVNVGVVRGGGEAVNVVPDYAMLRAEMRFWTQEERARLEQAVEELAGRVYIDGVRTEVTRYGVIPPLTLTPEAEAYRKRAQRVARSCGLSFLERSRGGLSDANQMVGCGVICVDAMGPAGGDDHTPNEYLLLDSVEPCIRLLHALLADLAAAK